LVASSFTHDRKVEPIAAIAPERIWRGSKIYDPVWHSKQGAGFSLQRNSYTAQKNRIEFVDSLSSFRREMPQCNHGTSDEA
jgi:hypothetical protein